MLKILQKGNKILEQKTKEVNSEDIQSAQFKKLIEEMKETLEKQEDGVALAAPQVGKSLRFFIVSPRAYKIKNTEGKPKKEDFLFINPEIIKLSKKKKWMNEGCLSVAGIFGKVERSINCTISAYDKNGNKFTRGAGGILSQVFQHEIDHLDGILFTEKAKDIQEIKPKK
ncbi:peptide deformylase [Patescibacteria group bacterium]|nr:peptide deformylase [Patescibacteria group bacterium]MCG2695171.1 peptide deformylase [Candidatus Parcubacteria bacterium]